MLLKGAMEGLIVVIIILYANAQSTTATDPFKYVPCYTDHCNVDEMMSCSQREKRCVKCQPYVHDCTINPDRLARIPIECIIYCRQRIQEEKRRLQYELKLNETIQAYENKIQELKRNIQTVSGEEKEASTQLNQPLCQPTWIFFWIFVAVGVVGWLCGLGCLFRYCIISIRRRERGTPSRTQARSQSSETRIEMMSGTDEQKAGNHAGDYASSGYGSKDTTFPKSKESQLAAPRVERETPRRAHPDLEIPTELPQDFIEQVERTIDKAEEQQRQNRMQRQQAHRQQDRDYSEQAEEGQSLLGSQIDDQENQQQQQQQQEGRPSQLESPTSPPYPISSPDNTDYQRDETKDIWQPRRGRSYETSGESRNNAHMPAVRTEGFHSQPEDGIAPSPVATDAAVIQGSKDGAKAYKMLMQVNPTSNDC